MAAHGDEVYTSTLYDHRGRVQQTSLPTWAPEQPEGYTTTAYDGLSRVVAVEHPHGTVERWSYGLLSRGLETLHTDERGVETRTQTDDAARVAVTIDAHATRTCFEHGPFGVLQEVRRDCADPSTPWVSTFDHDVAGRITFESDPSFGRRTYHYDGFGQLVEVETADEATVRFDYDGLGRLLARHDADGDTEHHYDVGRPGYLAWSESPDGVVLDYGYDASGRMSSVGHGVRALTNEPWNPRLREYYASLGFANGERLDLEDEQSLAMAFDVIEHIYAKPR